jgi:lipid II:glycine glycyltransferase (peptidoglycan interpeptide bridge formation enzyme)
MSIVSLTEWNQYVQKYPEAHLLQTGEWGELKSAFGWKPVRIVSGEAGVQILFEITIGVHDWLYSKQL